MRDFYVSLFMATLVGVCLVVMAKCPRADDWPANFDPAAELAAIEQRLSDAEEWIFVTGDPLMQSVICHLASGVLKVEELISVTGAPRDRVLGVIKRLMAREVLSPAGQDVVMFYDHEAAARLKYWAKRWCRDECGVDL